MPFELHPQLNSDCFVLGTLNNSTLLLHKNALLPWFILVPHTQKTEIYKIETIQQGILQQDINRLAQFVEQHFKTDKLNIATIGNIVPQLHVHIIGRHINDFCWPQPVWGQTDSREYDTENLQSIKQILVHEKIICA